MQMFINLIKLSYLDKKNRWRLTKQTSSFLGFTQPHELRICDEIYSFGSFSVSHVPGISHFTVVSQSFDTSFQLFHSHFTIVSQSFNICLLFHLLQLLDSLLLSFVFFFCAACLLCKPDRPTTDDTN